LAQNSPRQKGGLVRYFLTQYRVIDSGGGVKYVTAIGAQRGAVGLMSRGYTAITVRTQNQYYIR